MKHFELLKWVNEKTFSCNTQIYNYNANVELSLSCLKLSDLFVKKIGSFSFSNPIETYLQTRKITINLYTSTKSLKEYFLMLNDIIIEKLARHEYDRLYQWSIDPVIPKENDYYTTYYMTKHSLNEKDFVILVPNHDSNDDEAYNNIVFNIRQKWLKDVPQFYVENGNIYLKHEQKIDISFVIDKGYIIKTSKYELNYKSQSFHQSENNEKKHDVYLKINNELTKNSFRFENKLEIIDLKLNNYDFSKNLTKELFLVKYSINNSNIWYILAYFYDSLLIKDNYNSITINNKNIYNISLKICDINGKDIPSSGYCILHIKE